MLSLYQSTHFHLFQFMPINWAWLETASLCRVAILTINPSHNCPQIKVWGPAQSEAKLAPLKPPVRLLAGADSTTKMCLVCSYAEKVLYIDQLTFFLFLKTNKMTNSAFVLCSPNLCNIHWKACGFTAGTAYQSVELCPLSPLPVAMLYLW